MCRGKSKIALEVVKVCVAYFLKRKMAGKNENDDIKQPNLQHGNFMQVLGEKAKKKGKKMEKKYQNIAEHRKQKKLPAYRSNQLN